MTTTPAAPDKKPKWWQRPITWVITLVIGAAGAYITDAIVSNIKSVAPTNDLLAQAMGTDAFKIVDLHRVHDFHDGRWGYVVPAEVDPMPVFESPSEAGYRAWADANHAVDVRYNGWEMTIEGTRESTVEIVNIVPVLEEPCQEALGGGIVQDMPAGETKKIVLQAEVTKPNPTMTRYDPQRDGVPNYFGSNKVTLPRGEKNTFVLRAYAVGKYCRLRYRIDYLADGKRSEYLLGTPDGKPFEVTGYLANPTRYAWVSPDKGCRPDPKTKEVYTAPLKGSELSRLAVPCWPHD